MLPPSTAPIPSWLEEGILMRTCLVGTGTQHHLRRVEEDSMEEDKERHGSVDPSAVEDKAGEEGETGQG